MLSLHHKRGQSMKRTFATMLAVAVAGCGPQSSGDKGGATAPKSQSSQPAAPAPQLSPYVIRPLGTTGSDWRVIGASGNRPYRQIEMIDLKSLVISGDTRRIWMARVSEGAGDISYELMLNEYDCIKRTSKNISLAGTTRDGSLSVSEGSGKVSNIIPGTMGTNYLGYVCGNLNATVKFPAGSDPIIVIKNELRKVRKGELIVAILDAKKDLNRPLEENTTSLLMQVYDAAASNSGARDLVEDSDIPVLKAGISNRLGDAALSEAIFRKLGI